MTDATATFPAEYVRSKAQERIAKIDGERMDAREKKINSLMLEPLLEGPAWRKTARLRTREEAELHYETAGRFFTPYDFTENRFNVRLGRLRPLHRLASAALEANAKAVISLTASDCEALGVPASGQVPA